MHPNIRLARLRGQKAALRLHETMEVRENIKDTNGQIDVFQTLAQLDIAVVFKPLDGLLGIYIRGASPGALISTKRQPSVQRFTAAHELGHAVLLHEPSLDTPDVLRRAATGLASPQRPGFASWIQEVEADAFAGEFLMPRWLIVDHATAQGWSRDDLCQGSKVP